ncbi:unnamed protein product, partial [Rotaria sp. Silwood2]
EYSYGVPPQNQSGNFNPYVQQSQMPYPPQQKSIYRFMHLTYSNTESVLKKHNTNTIEK